MSNGKALEQEFLVSYSMGDTESLGRLTAEMAPSKLDYISKLDHSLWLLGLA